MSGLDERPMETYSNEKEEFECRRCHRGIIITKMNYGENIWWFDYKCLSCGYEGQKMSAEYKTQ